MDKFSVTGIRIFKAENDGWVAVAGGMEGPPRTTLGAFTLKADLLAWLSDHLYEPIAGEKVEATNDQ
jgi:hypothetical protein